MEESKKGFVIWIKQHKKQLIVAGISIAAIISLILVIKNRKAIMELWASLKRMVSNTSVKIPESKATVNVTIATETKTIPIQEISASRSLPAQQIPFDVSGHPRTLSKGWCASAEKIATAAENGYPNLLPNQTWVVPYIKGAIAA